MLEMYEDALLEKEELLSDLEQDAADVSVISARLMVIDEFLGENTEEIGDDLIDKWEAELAAGITPDLDEGM